MIANASKLAPNYFINKIAFLNVFLTILVVFLHAKTPERWGLALDMDYSFIYWTNVFTQIAVPTFFFISGLLFYRKCTFQEIERKLKSRAFSLLVPYLIWNTLFVILFFLMANIPSIHERMNAGNILSSPKEIIFAIVNARYTVLWFVKDLMLFCLLSAPIFILLRSLKSACLFLILSVVLALMIEGGPESVYKWFPMYFSGAIVGRFFVDRKDSYNYFLEYLSPTIRKCVVSLSMAVFIALWLLSGLYPEQFIFSFRFLSPILLWVLVDAFLVRYLQSGFQKRSWMKHMFFIYCTHQFVLNVIQKIVVLNCQPTQWILNVTYILSAVFTFCSLTYIANYLSKYRFYRYLSGGR